MTSVLDNAKGMGPIPDGFSVSDGELAIGGKAVSALIAEAGGETPLFVYDTGVIAAHVARLRAALPAGVGIHYAVKANPYPPLVGWIAKRVDGLDIASGGELALVQKAGADAAHVSFAGPGKTDRELAAALAAGATINLESDGEFSRLMALAGKTGERPRVAVRVNPDFELKASGMRMGGGAKPFGVDVDQVPGLLGRIKAAECDFRGFHIFSGSQNLDAAALIDAQAKTVALAARLAGEGGIEPPLVNLGGGFGIPYFPGDKALDVESIGAALGETLAARPAVLANTRFAIELGRWLVGEAGVYLTRVVDRKRSGGQTFLVCDGGMHHQLAASGNFGQVVRRNYPVANASRFAHPPSEVATIVGCLCTPLDRLGDQVALPETQEGDVIAVFVAGAYGASASPAAFLGHAPAREMFVGG
jgi:diaminopimelate decarboxylase